MIVKSKIPFINENLSLEKGIKIIKSKKWCCNNKK